MAQFDDAQLVARCLDGDRDAWTALVERYARLVWSIARKHGLSDADAEDMHQTTFASLIHHLGSLRDHARLSSWLITTAKRECWRLRKQATVQTNDVADLELEMEPDADYERLERQQLVREGMERLSARCRELLTALFAAVGEPSYPELAKQFGMPVGSIGPTRARCLSKLAGLLRGLGLSDH